MDQLEQNQDALHEEVSQVRAQIGKLMKTIQAIIHRQKIMVKMQEEMNQRAHATATPIPTAIHITVENIVPPQGHTPVQIPVGAPDDGSPPVIHPPVIEIDD